MTFSCPDLIALAFGAGMAVVMIFNLGVAEGRHSDRKPQVPGVETFQGDVELPDTAWQRGKEKP